MAFILMPDYWERTTRPIVYEVDLVNIGGGRPDKSVFEAMSEWAKLNLQGSHSYAGDGHSTHQRGDAPVIYKRHSTWQFETVEDAILFQLRWANSGCTIRPKPNRDHLRAGVQSKPQS